VDIPIDIPGLNQLIPSIPGGNLILLKGTSDPVKTYFVQYLANRAHARQAKVIYVSSRGREEVQEQFRKLFNNGVPSDINEEKSPMKWVNQVGEGNVLVVDSFSYLMFDKDVHVLRTVLEEVRRIVKEKGGTVVLTMDDGMFDQVHEAILMHLVDGIIEFMHKETSEGMRRFMRISRWMDGRIFDGNIYYTFDEMRINVDLRYRVV